MFKGIYKQYYYFNKIKNVSLLLSGGLIGNIMTYYYLKNFKFKPLSKYS